MTDAGPVGDDVTNGKGPGLTVSFTRMANGTPRDFEILDAFEREYAAGTADRVLHELRSLHGSLAGYQVDRLEHSLQTATRAHRDGAEDEMVVAALLHDVDDRLAPHSHGELAALILRPFVSDRTHWIVRHHGAFQCFYSAYGGDRNVRDRYREHPWYGYAVEFCARWDQCSFDPAYQSLPVEFFAPMVRRVFAREPFTAAATDRPIRPTGT